MNRVGKFTAALVAGLVLAMASFASFAASEFEGTWAVKNTKGEPFEITLAADGGAKSTLPEADKGTWKEEGGTVVISWESGWTTKIAKEGDKFVKTAFKKGAALDGRDRFAHAESPWPRWREGSMRRPFRRRKRARSRSSRWYRSSSRWHLSRRCRPLSP